MTSCLAPLRSLCKWSDLFAGKSKWDEERINQSGLLRPAKGSKVNQFGGSRYLANQRMDFCHQASRFYFLDRVKIFAPSTACDGIDNTQTKSICVFVFFRSRSDLLFNRHNTTGEGQSVRPPKPGSKPVLNENFRSK